MKRKLNDADRKTERKISNEWKRSKGQLKIDIKKGNCYTDSKIVMFSTKFLSKNQN